MAKIAPFKAIRYNPDKIQDLSKVVCPPYDVISSEQQQYYHDLSPYNFIHILLGKDIPGEDKYARAAKIFDEWLKKEIFIREDKPAIYFYSQQYNLRGEKRTRLGFISLLNLSDKNSSVFAHEHTRLAPKEDRFSLMKRVKANLSPIFIVFPDKKRIIQRVYQHYISQLEPFINIVDSEKIVHKLWKLDSADILNFVQNNMKGENIFIADGHHRYEVACAYRDEMQNKLGSNITGEESFNYILAYFTNTDHRGLLIMPIHRLLKLEPTLDFTDFVTRLKEYFDLEEIKDKTRFFFLMEKGGRTEHVLGMYKDKKYWLLRLKNIKTLDRMISDKPKVYRSLDVSILNTIILRRILGYNLENKENLIYGADADECIRAVDKNPLYLAFFLNPSKIQQVMQVAVSGERMPAKSTYFYPKVLSGLVVNKLEEI